MASILIIDDDPDTLTTLQKAIEILGHQALLAGSGSAGLKLASRSLPDLIITDLTLPDTPGEDLVAQLSSEPGLAGVPVIVHTARQELDLVERVRRAGARDFIHKPVRLKTLQAFLNRYIKEKTDTERP